MMVIMTYMTFLTTGVLEVTVATAKARFAACVREAEQGTTVVITKHGRRVAALVPAGDVEELRRLRAAGPKAGLASLAGGWEGSGVLHAQLGASNSLIADADLQIAATAVHHGLRLVTGNLKHFARVPGLLVERILAAVKTRP